MFQRNGPIKIKQSLNISSSNTKKGHGGSTAKKSQAEASSSKKMPISKSYTQAMSK